MSAGDGTDTVMKQTLLPRVLLLHATVLLLLGGCFVVAPRFVENMFGLVVVGTVFLSRGILTIQHAGVGTGAAALFTVAYVVLYPRQASKS